MESHLSTRYRVADLLADDVAASNLEASQSRQRRRQPGQVFDIGNVPAWLGWLFIYTFVLFYFSASRFVTLKSLVIKYSSVAEYSTRVKAAVMGLGFLENFVCTTYFATLLCAFDSLKRVAMGHHKSAAVVGALQFFSCPGRCSCP
ncbi:hypothetical protein Pcac1_g977 [Phytophthora cactorum]|nr:hypothetical protein Pcac1_g977 [Phytophthora cactorum]KAG2905330.1 hypothetical protein PC114_g11582 [Phytophthora cactorum]